jgi:hypothetical protein
MLLPCLPLTARFLVWVSCLQIIKLLIIVAAAKSFVKLIGFLIGIRVSLLPNIFYDYLTVRERLMPLIKCESNIRWHNSMPNNPAIIICLLLTCISKYFPTFFYGILSYISSLSLNHIVKQTCTIIITYSISTN